MRASDPVSQHPKEMKTRKALMGFLAASRGPISVRRAQMRALNQPFPDDLESR